MTSLAKTSIIPSGRVFGGRSRRLIFAARDTADGRNRVGISVNLIATDGNDPPTPGSCLSSDLWEESNKGLAESWLFFGAANEELMSTRRERLSVGSKGGVIMATAIGRFGLTALIVALFARASLAVPMAYEFSGVVERVYDSDAVLDGSVTQGTEFSGQFTFDSDAVDSNPDPSIGEYAGPAFSMTLNVGSYSWFSGAGNGDVRVALGEFYDDMMLGTPTAFEVGEGIEIFSMGVWFSHMGSIFTSDALPTMNPFPLSSLSNGLWVKGNNTLEHTHFELGGPLTSFTVVPEPTSVLFLMLAFGLLRRR